MSFTEFAADYFDGLSSRRHPVRVGVFSDILAIRGEGVSMDVDRAGASVQPRLGRTPLRIALAGGGLLVTPDFDAVAAGLGVPPSRTLAHRLESHPLAVVLAFAGLAVAAFFGYRDGIPWASRHVAENLPPALEAQLSEEALASADRFFLQPTKVPPERQAALRAAFDGLASRAGLPGQPRIEFRASFIGANAFTLPGGVIVVTDRLVRVMDDRRAAAVLAHELGHVRHRHGLRHVLDGSLQSLAAMAVFGDATAVAGLAATIPTALVTTGYSRDFEREADDFAFDLLRRAGRSPADFADAIDALQCEVEGRAGRGRGDRNFGYVSTHPGFAERRAAALAAAGKAPEAYPPAKCAAPPPEKSSQECPRPTE